MRALGKQLRRSLPYLDGHIMEGISKNPADLKTTKWFFDFVFPFYLAQKNDQSINYNL